MRTADGIRRAALVCVAVGVASCSRDALQVPWLLRFDDAQTATKAVEIEVQILNGGCGSSYVIYGSRFAIDATGPMPARTGPGRYGLYARARDESCRWIAAGCVEVALPMASGNAATVVLVNDTGSLADACAPPTCMGDCDASIVPGDPAPEPGDVVQVSSGAGHSCARTGSGAAYCWGENGYGQLGIGDNFDYSNRFEATPVARYNDFAEIAASYRFSCGLRRNGEVHCWGTNDKNQLGTNDAMPSKGPVQVLGLPADILQIATGTYHACALSRGQGVFCWGDSQETAAVSLSQALDTGDAIEAITVGGFHRCVRVSTLSGARAVCWGTNQSGELGSGTAGSTSAKVRVQTLTQVTDLSAGWSATCSIEEGTMPYCWGKNESRKLGIGVDGDKATPTKVVNVPSAANITMGQFHACARQSDGHVWCWGNNEKCQAGQIGTDGGCLLGADHTQTRLDSPMLVGGVSDAISLAAGYDHTCVLTKTRTVQCWGNNQGGALGHNPPGSIATPSNVMGLPTSSK